MTVFKDVSQLADAVYTMVVEIAQGKKVSGVNSTMNNGSVDVPSQLLDPLTIDNTNLDEVVKAGFISQDRFNELTK